MVITGGKCVRGYTYAHYRVLFGGEELRGSVTSLGGLLIDGIRVDVFDSSRPKAL